MISAQRGLFISFEGGDGAGKSSQIGRLADHLRRKGLTVRVTREPGGSNGAEAIRKLLVEGGVDRWSPLCEALMMYAARADHLERVIRPALARGEIVITDRFADSTMAYQGYAGGLGEEAVKVLHDLVVADEDPDLTLILDMPSALALTRTEGRTSGETRFEEKGHDFQEAVREAFQRIAKGNPDRCVVIDAAPDENTVFASVTAAVDVLLATRR